MTMYNFITKTRANFEFIYLQVINSKKVANGFLCPNRSTGINATHPIHLLRAGS